MPHPLQKGSRAAGFTMMEILIVLLIFGVVIAMAASITRGVVAGQRRTLTATRIAAVDAALVQFVQQQKRLPCPADGTLASSNNSAGLEGPRNPVTGCTSDQANGVVPWRTLALTETEATDGWERRMTYRVKPAEAADNALDASACDPAGTEGGANPVACTPGCVSTSLATCTPPSRFLQGRGLTICDTNGNGATFPCPGARRLMDKDALPHTGAAYVVISHGESGGGARLASGNLSTSTTTDGLEERINYVNRAYNAGEYLVDGAVAEGAGDAHFDDMVSRPSLLSVITKAGLGPRSH